MFLLPSSGTQEARPVVFVEVPNVEHEAVVVVNAEHPEPGMSLARMCQDYGGDVRGSATLYRHYICYICRRTRPAIGCHAAATAPHSNPVHNPWRRRWRRQIWTYRRLANGRGVDSAGTISRSRSFSQGCKALVPDAPPALSRSPPLPYPLGYGLSQDCGQQRESLPLWEQ